MTVIEWKGEPLDGNSVFIDLKNEKHIIPDNHITAIQMKKHGIDGYVDGNNAFKVINPGNIRKKGELNITSRTLTEKGGLDMSDKFDNRYHDLKEDLRESERRISQEVKDRESRFEKSMERYSQEAKEREERFMQNIEEIKTIVADGEKNRKSTSIAMWTLAITTLLGIAAMVITVVLSI